MDNVKTYDGHGEPCIPEACYFIRKTDFDAALSREAALREELATQDRVLRSSVPEEHKGCTSPVGAVQNYIGDLEQRLTAAEQRNAELAELLARNVYEKWVDQDGYIPWVNGGNSLKQDEARRIALSTPKPTESGASE